MPHGVNRPAKLIADTHAVRQTDRQTDRRTDGRTDLEWILFGLIGPGQLGEDGHVGAVQSHRTTKS